MTAPISAMLERKPPCWNCDDTGWAKSDYPPEFGKRPCVRCEGHQEKRARYRALRDGAA